jgi:DNA-binding transcriptional LysR family regulator
MKNILKIGLDPLLHFEVIARLQSLKKASDELGLSQPAVTQSLNKLEQNLNRKT